MYEAVHPETANGGTGRSCSKVGQVGQAIQRFTADTAAKTGKPERTIRLYATRAKALGPDLDRVARTSFDKGTELDVPLASADIDTSICNKFARLKIARQRVSRGTADRLTD